MSAEHFDLERICRLKGMAPTARDRWTAFYRLWRLVRNHCAAQLW